MITKKVNLLIIKSSNYDLLIGIDLITNFSLNLTNNLRVFQKINFHNEIIVEEIYTNYSNTIYNNTINDISESKLCSDSKELEQNASGKNAFLNINTLNLRSKNNTNKYNDNLNSNKSNIDNFDKTKSKDFQNNITKNLNANLLIENLNSIQKEELKNLLTKYNNTFSKDKYDIGSINIEQCKVELTNNIPINLRPYRCSLNDQKIINEQIEMLLSKNLIRKSISPYAFPVTLADKKDDGKRTRLCVDMRKLNQIVIADNYPFPRLEDIIDKLHNSEYFSTLDISSGFWHLKVAPKDTNKFAFVTMNDHYEWLVMPFGFRNSPAIFQRVIYAILKKHNLTEFAHNYIDDILIHSKSFDEHLTHLEKVLKAMQIENIKLKLSKCKFAEKEVKYLGHKISLNKVIPLNDNTASIAKFSAPKTVKQVQQLLGKINFYHKYIPSAAKMLSPLYNLLKKDTQFKWDDSCQKAFDKIKEYLMSEPILAIFNPNEECFVFTDASKLGLGAVLKQKQADGTLKPIAYFSKKLLKYQEHYDVSELECLCIVEAVDFWHHYLYDNKFTVVTDHNALKWLKSIKKPNSRLFKWSLKLSQYNMDIKYQPGKANVEADCLSRNPVLESFTNKDHIKIINLIEKSDIISAQQECTEIPKNCKVKNDLIVKLKNNFHKIYIPEKLRFELIKQFHLEFGHIGVKKVLNLLSTCYYWPNMTQSIKQYVDACKVCQENKVSRTKKLGSLSQIGPAKGPYEIVSIDTIGGLSGYNSTKQYIHVAIDNFTRFIWTLSSKTQSSKDFINLVKNIMQSGKPELIVADRYTGINSNEFLNFLDNNTIKFKFITVNCPQSNGICERANQTIMTRLRCKFNDNNQKVNWPKLLVQVVQEYNDTPHDVTTFSPNHLMYNKKTIVNDELNLSLEKIREIAFINSQWSHEKNKYYYDKNHIQYTFNEGDLVYVENKNDISRRKLEPIMTGPFKVLKKLSDISYVIECRKKGKKSDIFHISKLKPYKTLL